MAMLIEKNKIVFSIPNSEASINAQRIGIKDRTVGQYYMNEKADQVESFFSNSSSVFYVDLLYTYELLKDLVFLLHTRGCGSLYKNGINEQLEALKTIEWAIKNSQESLFFHTISPRMNDKRKYLKFPSDNESMRIFKTLCLADVVNICIEKLTENCFRVYATPREGVLHSLVNRDTFEKWIAKNSSSVQKI